MKNSIFLLALGILISIFRLHIDGNEAIDLIFIMALINTVAFDYVILLIIIDIRKEIEQKLIQSSLPDKQKAKCKNRINFILCVISIFIFIIFSILYVVFFRSSSLNDILSIMALMLSILQSQISKNIGEFIYLKI